MPCINRRRTFGDDRGAGQRPSAASQRPAEPTYTKRIYDIAPCALSRCRLAYLSLRAELENMHENVLGFVSWRLVIRLADEDVAAVLSERLKTPPSAHDTRMLRARTDALVDECSFAACLP